MLNSHVLYPEANNDRRGRNLLESCHISIPRYQELLYTLGGIYTSHQIRKMMYSKAESYDSGDKHELS